MRFKIVDKTFVVARKSVLVMSRDRVWDFRSFMSLISFNQMSLPYNFILNCYSSRLNSVLCIFTG